MPSTAFSSVMSIIAICSTSLYSGVGVAQGSTTPTIKWAS